MTEHERPETGGPETGGPETGGDYIHGYDWDRTSVPPVAARAADTARRWSGRRAVQGTALVAAGLVAGVLVVGAWPSGGSVSDAANTRTTGSVTGSQQNGGAPGSGQQPGSPGDRSPGDSGLGDGGLAQSDPRSGGRGGGLEGEQRLTGTITAIRGSALTFRASDGATATYTLDASTLVVKDGAPASLTDVKPGDAAHLHIYPQGATTMVERIFVGTLPDFGVNGGPGPGPDGAGDSDGSGAATTARSA